MSAPAIYLILQDLKSGPLQSAETRIDAVNLPDVLDGPNYRVNTMDRNGSLGPLDILKKSLLRPLMKCSTRLPSVRL